MNKRKALLISFIISIVYVGFGTYSLLASIPSAPYHNEWSVFGLLLTLPVNFIAFGIAFSISKSLNLILLIQVFMFLLFWYLVYRYMNKKYRNICKAENRNY